MQNNTQQPLSQQMPAYQAAPVVSEEEDSINISDFLSLCVRCWKWFAFSVAACLIIGALYVLTSPKIYTRTAQVVVQDDEAGSGSQSITSALSDMGLFTTSTKCGQ